MKWRLYKLCCLLNAIITLTDLFLVLYFFVIKDRENLDLSFFLFLLGLAIVSTKNFIGYKLHERLDHEYIPTHVFRVSLFIIWILNLIIYVIVFIFVLAETNIQMIKDIPNRSLTNIFIIASIYLSLFTFAYTLIFDIPLERKIRKQHNIIDELLKDNSEN